MRRGASAGGVLRVAETAYKDLKGEDAAGDCLRRTPAASMARVASAGAASTLHPHRTAFCASDLSPPIGEPRGEQTERGCVDCEPFLGPGWPERECTLER